MKPSVAILGIIVLLCVWGLIIRDRKPGNGFHLEGFLQNADGTPSRSALVLLGSFLVASWVVVVQSMRGTLTDLLYGTYLATYAIPAVSNQISNTVAAIKGSTPATTTTRVEQTTVTP